MQQSFLISPEVSFREVGDEVFILHRNDHCVHNLNETAADIWRGLKKGNNVTTIAKDLSNNYDIDNESALHDVIELIEELVKKKIIIPA